MEVNTNNENTLYAISEFTNLSTYSYFNDLEFNNTILEEDILELSKELSEFWHIENLKSLYFTSSSFTVPELFFSTKWENFGNLINIVNLNITSIIENVIFKFLSSSPSQYEWSKLVFSFLEAAGKEKYSFPETNFVNFYDVFSVLNNNNKLKNIYILEGDVNEICEYLSKNKELWTWILDKIPTKLNQYFPEAKLVLKKIPSFEENEKSEILIYIQTHLNPEEAIEKLFQFDEEWWLDVPFKIRNHICIDVECLSNGKNF